MIIEPDSLIRATTSTIQASGPLVACLDPGDSGISSESEVCSDAEENASKKESTDEERNLSGGSQTEKSSWWGTIVPLIWNDVQEIKFEFATRVDKLVQNISGSGKLKTNIPTKFKTSEEESRVNQLNDTREVIRKPITTTRQERSLKKIQKIHTDKKRDERIAATNLQAKENQPEIEPTFRSPNGIGREFLSLSEYMRCNKGGKENRTGNLNFAYKVDNLRTGKRLSWLKRFRSWIWNNIQEGIPEAAESSLSIQSDKKSLVDASNSLGVGVMPPPRKQMEDCKGRSVPRLLVISERLPPENYQTSTRIAQWAKVAKQPHGENNLGEEPFQPPSKNFKYRRKAIFC